MPKWIITIFAILLYPLVPVFADCSQYPDSGNCTYIDIASGSNIAVVLHDLSYVLGIVAFLLLLVGGFQVAVWFFKR